LPSTAATAAATDAVAVALTDAAGLAIYATKVELSAAKTEMYDYLDFFIIKFLSYQTTIMVERLLITII
jgi:hypothetical protein